MFTTRFRLGHSGVCRMFCCAFALIAAQVSAGQVLYVDASATGAGDGSIWCDAYVHLQDALSAAQGSGGAVTEVRVAQGVYKPDRGAGQTSGDRNATFRLLSGVSLMGGYAGCGAPDPDARDFALYETVLSGDLNGDDEPDFANYAENSYHVVTYDDPTATGVVIDGFTISGGNADGADALTNQGGGIHIRKGLDKCIPGGPTVRNCIVENNWAAHHGAINDHGLATVIENCIIRNNYAGEEGGGLQIHSGAPTITNTIFENNISDGEGGGVWAGADDDPTCIGSSEPAFIDCHFSGNVAFRRGGGLFLRESHAILQRCAFDGNSSEYAAGMYIRNSSPTLFDCTFIGNSATRGGGIYSSESNPTLTNCTFSGNQAYATAGGIYNENSNPTLANCLFNDNTADLHAGGMANLNNSSPTLTNCSFIGNSANSRGGGVYNGGSPTLTNCIFINNSAQTGGGMHNLLESNPAVTNCVFSGNSANEGGGMYNSGNSNPNVMNCTFSGNKADEEGGGMFNSEHGENSPIVTNCIFWGNVADANSTNGGPFIDEFAQIYTVSGIPMVNYSIVQGGWSGAGGVGVLAKNPMFVNPAGPDGIVGTEDDNLRPSPGSPAIKSGDNSSLPPNVETDLDGNPRIIGGTVDLGAYEFQCSGDVAFYGDVNSDGSVNFLDVSLILDVFRGTPTSIEFEDADIAPCGGDGNVNFADVSAAVDAFRGVPPCPNVCL